MITRSQIFGSQIFGSVQVASQVLQRIEVSTNSLESTPSHILQAVRSNMLDPSNPGPEAVMELVQWVLHERRGTPDGSRKH